MRALSREELEQMLQNDFLMASSCDAEQVVQVGGGTHGPGRAVGSSNGGPGHRRLWKPFGNAMKESGARREQRAHDGGGKGDGWRQRFWRRCWPLRFCPRRARGDVPGPQPMADGGQPQIAGETLEVQVEEAGRMTIRYFIAGKGQVEALGAEEIVIRHKVGGVWMETVRYDRKTDELWTEGTMEYGGEISYQGRPGERYQVEVLFFAENEAGYDSRRQTWEVTAE